MAIDTTVGGDSAESYLSAEDFVSRIRLQLNRDLEDESLPLSGGLRIGSAPSGGGDGLSRGEVLALIASWARGGNTDPIPEGKLTNAPSGGGAGAGLDVTEDKFGIGSSTAIITQAAGDPRVFHDLKTFTAPSTIEASGVTNTAAGIRVGEAGIYSAELQLSFQLSSAAAGDWGVSILRSNGLTGAQEVLYDSGVMSEHTDAISGVVESFVVSTFLAAQDFNLGDHVYAAFSFSGSDNTQANSVNLAISPAPTESFIKLRRFIGSGPINGLTAQQVDDRVAAGVADWAEKDNTDPIPAGKLTNAPSGGGLSTGDVDNRIAQQVSDWAEQGNSGTIPENKLPAAATEGLNQDEVDARVAAGVQDWAEEGNNLAIPDGKLPNIPASKLPTAATEGLNQDEVDARIANWAESGNGDDIPATKLDNAPNQAADFAKRTGASGTIPDARIPNLPASKLSNAPNQAADFAKRTGASGTIPDARIPNLPASKLSNAPNQAADWAKRTGASGTIPDARLPTSATEGLNQAEVNALIGAQVENFAKVGNAADVPKSKLPTNQQLPVPAAGKFLGWNAAGNAVENKDAPGGMFTLADDLIITLTIRNGVPTQYGAFTLFTNAYTVDEPALLLIQSDLAIAGSNNPSIANNRVVQTANRSSIFDVRSAGVYVAGQANNGRNLGSFLLYRGPTSIGALELRIARNAQGRLGYLFQWRQTNPPNTTWTVTYTLDAVILG